jgi:preprotein translocase subunit SecF
MTGDFLNKGVSLKGGISITVPLDQGLDTDALKQQLALTYPNNDVSIREISSRGRVVGFSLDIDVDPSNDGTTNAIIDEIRSFTNLELNKGEYSLETIGSSLGSSFFRETFRSILLAFIFMAVVVMLYFRKLVPALIVILAVVSDIIATLAVVNLLGIKLSTGGIAAFLMLIGYSVDTDMLLSTRMLKKQGLSMHDRIMGALKTGLLMTITTIIAVTTALVFTQSAVIKQIMTILLIGLIFDLIFTWFQNMGVLRLYLEKKEGRTENEL